MKVILAVAAVLLAVTHVGDAHGDHSHPHAPYRESVLLIALQMCTCIRRLGVSLRATVYMMCVFCNEVADQLPYIGR